MYAPAVSWSLTYYVEEYQNGHNLQMPSLKKRSIGLTTNSSIVAASGHNSGKRKSNPRKYSVDDAVKLVRYLNSFTIRIN